MFTEPVPADSKLVVSNALYFNATWDYEFEHELGIEANFTSFNDNITLTLMSSDMDVPYLVDEELGMQIASLPYEHTTRGK